MVKVCAYVVDVPTYVVEMVCHKDTVSVVMKSIMERHPADAP